jgi:uncharacterized lipoprotein YehR (DUF1307 family)
MSNIQNEIEKELKKAVSTIQNVSDNPEQVAHEIKKATSTIQDLIENEREQARAVCDIQGSNSSECAAAWDAVEELQAEASHQRNGIAQPMRNSLEQYCDENPDAAECRIYDE